MKTARAELVGRFGNNLFIWAHAKAFCERNGYELRTREWPGEKIFTLDGATHARPQGNEDIVIEGYKQTQDDLIYTRADCRRWFKWKPEIAAMLDMGLPPRAHAHLRRGDYHRSGYPTVSVQSVYRAAREFGIIRPIRFVSDAEPTLRKDLPPELDFLQDFYDMANAPVLFRGNSSFSYWAAVLGNGEVFSPLINGLAGGVEHEVAYARGNWPACADLPGVVTDLHLREE